MARQARTAGEQPDQQNAVCLNKRDPAGKRFHPESKTFEPEKAEYAEFKGSPLEQITVIVEIKAYF